MFVNEKKNIICHPSGSTYILYKHGKHLAMASWENDEIDYLCLLAGLVQFTGMPEEFPTQYAKSLHLWTRWLYHTVAGKLG